MAQHPNRKRPFSSVSGANMGGEQGMTEEQAINSNVKVVVRVRPENAKERDGGYNNIVRVMDEQVLVFDPKEDHGSPDYYHGKRRKRRDIMKRQNKDMRYAFDRVFSEYATNQEVYENTTMKILDGFMDGYNCSVFAYGATGAGKTFSMLGSPSSPGVIFLTMMELYRRIELMKEEKICDVAVSYLEVYNEQIRDLLMPSNPLPIREDPAKGVVVAGLSLHKPKTADELMYMLDFGNQNRTQHPTDANAESSRSHAVFQVFVRQKDRTANISTDFRVAKMSLIDLAGSERATVTTNRGARFREGANINRSLLALGNCINALADGKVKGQHVPYRNSKLTRLLKDSLGGNCRTVMIAAVSPSAMTYDDTHNTLKYANRAKNIKASLKRNVVSVDFHISKYAQICEDLRKEVAELKEKLKNYEEGSVEPPAKKAAVDTAFQDNIERLDSQLYNVFKSRQSIRKEILEYECADRDLDLKIYKKEKALARLANIALDGQRYEQACSRIQRTIDAAKSRQTSLRTRLGHSEEKMQENVSCLQRLEEEMKACGRDGVMPEMLSSHLSIWHLDLELRDTKRHVKCLRKIARNMEREAQASDRLMSALLTAFKKQYLILKGHNLATSDIEAEFDGILELAETGDREVVWADQSMGSSETREGRHESDFSFDKLLSFPVLSFAASSRINTPVHTPNHGSQVTVAAPQSDSSHAEGLYRTKSQTDLTQGCFPVPDQAEQSPGQTVTLKSSIVSNDVVSTKEEHCLNETFSLPVEECTQLQATVTATISSQQPTVVFAEATVENKAMAPVHIGQNAQAVAPKSNCSNSITKTDTLRNQNRVHTPPPSDLHFQSQGHQVQSQTITKSQSGSVVVAEESELGEKCERKPKSHVVRAMQFEGHNIGSPVGKMSFADAVKSPARSAVFQAHRAPLSPLTNTPQRLGTPKSGPSLESSQSKNDRRMTFAKSDGLGGKPTSQQQIGEPVMSSVSMKNMAALQKMGLPSMLDKSASVSRPVPKYMQLTASAAYKRRHHKRSWSSKENSSPADVDTSSGRRGSREDTRAGPVRSLAKSRSKSVNSLNRTGWQR
ncbi:kinesin-like protein KIF18A isoform X2 [Lingula anatina]|uniref:Kinesin-like protein KIF18A isoform X2 n=1 Tax=Lingula anatina TaxID=7574 RepID=A0A2R2MI71_LINAN|nr:kinesin-like protein KIF18A isoform X2 [Lingula anatina]|eukprot:XP_023929910.1 kinesin-like protein KIF18A isoform X2 [Lingula anatina]